MNTNTVTILSIRDKIELEKHMFFYNCSSVEELRELLDKQYNTIIDIKF